MEKVAKRKYGLFSVVFLIIVGLFLSYSPLYAASVNVAIVDSVASINGGSFPTTTSGPTGDFNNYNFTMLPVASVNATNLASFDTVLLNMASSGMNCDSSNLTSSQQADLVNFVNGGGKLIIHDSECPAIDYSWLPYAFTTNNPGQNGASGTLTIDEDNDLSHSNPANSKYIDATLMASNTDAAGDMNVMTTRDPHWCLDMSGQNSSPAQGPVHTYATYGSGLIIWNGLDIDYMDTSTSPDSSTAWGNIAKLWLQELQVDNNALPCGTTVVPTVTSVPTMTDWGMIIFVVLAGVVSIYYLRRRWA